MKLIFFLLAMLIPWMLGFSLVKPFLKQRSGYLFFAIGVGYVLGWFITTLVLRIYDYFGRPFNVYEIIVVECFIAIPLLFLKIKELRVDEIGLERPPSKLIWSLSVIIALLLCYRWGLTAIDLVNKPIFPWDGWLSWSAKAKIFYYSQGIPTLSQAFTPFWDLADPEIILAHGARHPYFVSLIQTYTAMAWGTWSDGIVNIPWLGLSIATCFGVFGGLRYLGSGWFPSVLAAYLVVSMPIFDTHVSLGSYADLWVGVAFLFTSLLAAALLHQEWRLLLLILIFALIVYFSKNTAIIFLVGIVYVLAWRLVGWKTCLAITIISGLCLYWLVSKGEGDNYEFFLSLLSSDFRDNMFALNFSIKEFVWREWIQLDNWHYAFVAAGFGFFLAFFQGREDEPQLGLVLLATFGFMAFVVMLFVVFFTKKISHGDFVGYVNRISLYFMPLLILFPVSIYKVNKKYRDNTGLRCNSKPAKQDSSLFYNLTIIWR